SVIGTAPANATSFRDTGTLTVGQTYYYQVRAVRGATQGSVSNVVNTGVVAVGGTGITVNGSANVIENDPSTTTDNVIQITDNVNDQRGSFFTSNARPIEGANDTGGFNTTFVFQIPEHSDTPADGFAFVIQRDGANPGLFAGGGGLHYVRMPN